MKIKTLFFHFSDSGDALRDYINQLNPKDPVQNQNIVDDDKNLVNFDKLSNYEKQAMVSKFLKPGHKLIMQVTKEPIRSKGARVSTDISIPGRFLALIPMRCFASVSKKIRNYKERERLKNIVLPFAKKNNVGVIIRTQARNQPQEAILQDVQELAEKWNGIWEQAIKAQDPCCLHAEEDTIFGIIRESFPRKYQQITVDNPSLFKNVKKHIQKVEPEMAQNVILYNKTKHLFDHKNISSDIDSIFRKNIPLKSGGYLIIEQTEAMYVIDVNSGPYFNNTKQEQNSLRINIEAAREIAKQVRLRDIGGIIVVDFIDLYQENNRDHIYKEIRTLLKNDPAKTSVLKMSSFGLMQITRERIRPNLFNRITDSCPMCLNNKKILDKDTIITNIEDWLTNHKKEDGKKFIDLYLHPYLYYILRYEYPKVLRHWIVKFRLWIRIKKDMNTNFNKFKVYARNEISKEITYAKTLPHYSKQTRQTRTSSYHTRHQTRRNNIDNKKNNFSVKNKSQQKNDTQQQEYKQQTIQVS